MSFELKLEKLEKIVNEMEKKDITLDNMLKNYENGMDLIIELNKKLKNVEKKISVLTEKSENEFQLDEFGENN